MQLILNRVPSFVGPDPDTIAREVESVLLNGGYALIEREDQHYIQVGSGWDCGMQGRPGYAVEYRDGSPGAHFRYETEDMALLIVVLQAFAERDETYRVMVPWRHYPLYEVSFVLSSGNGPNITHPEAPDIERAVKELGQGNSYVLVKREDGWYHLAGMRGDGYLIEYQHGSTEPQYWCETSDATAVRRFLREFLEDKDSWKDEHSWQELIH